MTIARGDRTASLLAKLSVPEPSEISQLVEVMRRDHLITLAERVLRAVAKTAKVNVSVQHNAPEGSFEWQRQTLLSEQLDALWWTTLSDLMDWVAYGRVAFEKVWRVSAKANLRYIEVLKPLPFSHTQMILEDDGSFGGILVRSKRSDIADVRLEPRYSWWAALNPRPLEPHGVSMFTGAPFYAWRTRENAKRLRTVFTERFALGGGVAHVPSPDDPSVPEVHGQKPDTFKAAAEAHAARQSGGLMILSNVRDEHGNYVWDYEDYDTSAQDSTPIIELIDSLDAEQLLSFGIPPKTVIEGSEVGSFALVTWQVLILYSVVDDILHQGTTSFKRYVIDKSAEMNWGDTHPAFRIEYTPLMERPDELAPEIVKAWLTSPQLSPLVLSGAVNVEAILESVGIPLSQDVSQRIKAILSGLARERLRPRVQTMPPVDTPGDTGDGEGDDAGDKPPNPTEMAGPLSPFLNRGRK